LGCIGEQEFCGNPLKDVYCRLILSDVVCREGPINALAAPPLPASYIDPSPQKTRLRMTLLVCGLQHKQESPIN
jgi:hypothetical protein